MSLWKKKKAKACIQARLRKRDSDGNIIIDMTVSNGDDFLSVYSTSHTPVISTDVAAFIENSGHSISVRESIALHIHSNCIDDGEKMEYASAMKEYYAEKYVASRKELRLNRIIALLLLIAGVLVLTFAFHIEHHLWSEVIDIAAWVLLWEAVDIWAFKNRELVLLSKRYLAFMNMKVEYLHMEKK